MSNNELKKKIVKWAKEYKFSNVGFTDIDLSIEEERLKDWLNNKFHGDMHYMEKHGEKRTKPELLTPGTLSIISFSANYLDFNTENPIKVLQTKDKAYISRYALGQDYHFIMKDKLKKIAQLINQHTDSFKYRTFVDSAPVMEKPIAEKAGLGWIGKHTNLINRDNGSWFFIGEIYSNIRFDIDKKEDNFCGSCSNCISACPTNAIVAPYKLDARKCISYLTIENKGAPLFSIVKYDIHFLASSLYGATMALVGQALMQLEHDPQKLSSFLSISNLILEYISPIKNQEPLSRLIRLVCFPIQPRPAFSAIGFSITGAESTKVLYLKESVC